MTDIRGLDRSGDEFFAGVWQFARVAVRAQLHGDDVDVDDVASRVAFEILESFIPPVADVSLLRSAIWKKAEHRSVDYLRRAYRERRTVLLPEQDLPEAIVGFPTTDRADATVLSRDGVEAIRLFVERTLGAEAGRAHFDLLRRSAAGESFAALAFDRQTTESALRRRFQRDNARLRARSEALFQLLAVKDAVSVSPSVDAQLDLAQRVLVVKFNRDVRTLSPGEALTFGRDGDISMGGDDDLTLPLEVGRVEFRHGRWTLVNIDHRLRLEVSEPDGGAQELLPAAETPLPLDHAVTVTVEGAVRRYQFEAKVVEPHATSAALSTRDRALLALLRQGRDRHQISETLGMSPAAVGQAIVALQYKSPDDSTEARLSRALGRQIDLTPREAALVSVASSRSARQIAVDMHLSVNTVRILLNRLYAKLGVHSRGELAALLDTVES